MRRTLYGRLACVAALLVGALLAVAFRLSVPSDSAERYDRAKSRPIVVDSSGPETASTGISSPPTAHGVLVCAVLEDDTRQPIHDATVFAVADRPAQYPLGFRLTAILLGQASTDTRGIALLPFSEALAPTDRKSVV